MPVNNCIYQLSNDDVTVYVTIWRWRNLAHIVDGVYQCSAIYRHGLKYWSIYWLNRYQAIKQPRPHTTSVLRGQWPSKLRSEIGLQSKGFHTNTDVSELRSTPAFKWFVGIISIIFDASLCCECHEPDNGRETSGCHGGDSGVTPCDLVDSYQHFGGT
jgi:hypothetical protein